ncbi:MAG TPA: hypothetical protein VIS48_16315 [Candidatus Kryptonia bacterium]
MFIGHFGVGFAAKRVDSRPSLGTMFLAAQLLDVLWPVFLLLGIERVRIAPVNDAFLTLHFTYYPFSHSLLASIVWSLLFAFAYYLIRKNMRGSIVLGLLVFSHWILDFLTHIPDLPLYPGSEVKVGLGMWNSTVLTIVVEGFIFVAGAWIYIASTKSKNLRGKLALWGLLLFLGLAYASDLMSPPPPSTEALAIVGIFMWLLVAWAYWIDRNRITKVSS